MTLKAFAQAAAAQALRLVPGSAALRWKRDLRDAAWLADANAVVVSFPKSGRTFVRAMLARLLELKFGIDERKLLDFPSLKCAEAAVPRLLFVHAGDAMREPEGYFSSARLKPAKTGDERSQKVREGGSGGYRARVGEVEAARIDAYISEHLDPVFGYAGPAKAKVRRKQKVS